MRGGRVDIILAVCARSLPLVLALPAVLVLPTGSGAGESGECAALASAGAGGRTEIAYGEAGVSARWTTGGRPAVVSTLRPAGPKGGVWDVGATLGPGGQGIHGGGRLCAGRSLRSSAWGNRGDPC